MISAQTPNDFNEIYMGFLQINHANCPFLNMCQWSNYKSFKCLNECDAILFFTLDFGNELFDFINLYQLIYIEKPINFNGVLRILYFL